MMVTKIMLGIIHSPTKPMLDALILDHLDRTYFGKVRLFGVLGSGLGSYLGGKLLIYAKEISAATKNNVVDSFDDVQKFSYLWKKWFTDEGKEFNLLFLAHIVLTIPTFLAIQQLQNTNNNNKEQKSKNQEKKDHDDVNNTKSSIRKTDNNNDQKQSPSSSSTQTESLFFCF